MKKSRNKPLYKSFVVLKKNVQNRRRLNLLKFKKKKWEKLINYIRRLQNRRKKNFKVYDINRYYLPKFYNSFKKKYEYMLHTKKKFRIFYGNVTNKFLKKNIKTVLKQKSKMLKHNLNFNSFFLKLWESRIDVVLYRSHFVPSISAAKQLIFHKHISINGKSIKDSSLKLKKGDLVTINNQARSIIYQNIKNTHFWPISPYYLQINYKTLEIYFLSHIETHNFSASFPFWLDIYTLLRYYDK